ncbi:MAG: ABC transporter permease [Chloroflexi bacterium]|nr:MAG: ABC transporter permease [Chloroflexota bacterium]RLC87537.1 MAG: ABC transporter permease [Chloroflexota bacterium]
MRQRIWAVIQKEFIQTMRDRRTLMMLLSMPIIQLLLFGYAVHMSVEHIPTAVADQSRDSASQAYVSAMEASGYFDVVAYVPSQAEVTRAIDEGRVQAGIVIPPDFAAHVEQGDAQALFLVDGSDLFTSQSAYNAATAIADVHATGVLLEKLERSGQIPQDQSLLPLDALVRILYNPNLTDLWFIIPGMCAMILQTQTIALTTAAVVREREMGTIEQLLVTPILPIELMIGKIVPNIIIALINMLTILALGVFTFHVPFQGSFWLFFWLAFMYVFSGLGLGLLISTISQNQQQAQQMNMALALVGMLLGGFMFPRSAMPAALRLVGNLFPLTYFIPISRGIITKGIGIEFLWGQVVALLIYVFVVMTIASRAFKQGLD